ncbi:MAG: hypothetical protein JNK58_09550 [Phycisphaerae bacterium]|nr:hypothetical protein [Phycisphaerae bacterium]
MIAYFASDLVWATRIKACADDLGLPARPVRNLDMLNARLGDSPVRGLIVDLDQPETATALIRRAREWSSTESPTEHAARSPIRIVAFGPHVETEALGEARRLGADAVMTRGAFHARLADVLRDLGRP